MSDDIEKRPEEPQKGPQMLASSPCEQAVAALAAAQGAFAVPKRTKEASIKGRSAGGHDYSYKYTYAPLEEILAAVGPALAANGLARHQFLIQRGNGTWLRSVLWHASGQWIASDYPVYPTKEDHQGFASGVSYARRYGLSLLTGVAPEDDDDGNVADGRDIQNNEQVKRPSGAQQPKVKPLPEQPKNEPPHDETTGELLKPHRIPVPTVTKDGQELNNWPAWGGALIAALNAAKTLDEALAWADACLDDYKEAEKKAKNTAARVKAAGAEAQKRLAEFMPGQEAA